MGHVIEPITYWKPSDALQGLVSGYHRFVVPPQPGGDVHDAFFPGWASIRISDNDWSLQMGSRTFPKVPRLAFIGPTSYAGYVAAHGGTLIGAGIQPMGWAQLFGGDVSRFANRVVLLEQVDPGAETLARALEAGAPPVEALQEWLEARLQRRPPIDPRIAQLFAMLHDPLMSRSPLIADALSVSPKALNLLTRINFGFPPKLLMRRTRFLRALGAVLTQPDDGPAVLDEAGYWDRSHFLRDCQLFLGCSVRDFNKRRSPLSQMALNARADVLGSAV